MIFAGQVAEAVIKGEEVVGRFGQSAPAHAILGDAYLAAGAMDKALQQYRLALGIDFLPEAVACQGFLYGLQGRRKLALNCLDSLHRAKEEGQIAYVSSWFTALIHTGLGEKEKALNALDEAFKEKCDWLIYLAVEPRWKILHNEKRFRTLQQRVGIGRLKQTLPMEHPRRT